MYINVHTHSTEKEQQSVAVLNLHEAFDNIPDTGLFSAGLHPWFIDDNTTIAFTQLQHAVHKQNVLAVGECGLDKKCTTDFQLQQHWFIQQLQLANEMNKPVMIHCVRAFDEVLHLLENHKVYVPVVFHGFHKSIELAKRIIKQGYYLSFGRHLLHPSVQDVFNQLPVNSVLLETDDSSVPIQSIYKAAADALNSNEDTVCSQLLENAIRVFGKNITEL